MVVQHKMINMGNVKMVSEMEFPGSSCALNIEQSCGKWAPKQRIVNKTFQYINKQLYAKVS